MAVEGETSAQGSKSGNYVPADFLTEELKQSSTVSRALVEDMQRSYVEDDAGVRLVHCTPKERPNHQLSPDIHSYYVHLAHFKYGLRIPICRELLQILNFYGVLLAQLLPNSMASIMTYIIYLRRKGIPFTINGFQQSFGYRVLKGGYCQFPVRGDFSVTGLENKVPGWKPAFVRIIATHDLGLPKNPQSVKLKVPKLKRRTMSDLDVILDVRQYVLDVSVLKRSLYPETYTALSIEEWRESDRVQLARPIKDQHPKVEKKRKRAPLEFEEVEETSADNLPATTVADPMTAMVVHSSVPTSIPTSIPTSTLTPTTASVPTSVLIPVPTTTLPTTTIPSVAPLDESTIPSPTLAVEASGQETPREEGETQRESRGRTVEAERLKKRSISRKKGKAIIIESPPPEQREKVRISNDGKMAFVNLRKEWYQIGEAAPLGAVLSSDRLDARLEVMTEEEAKDSCARHLGATWRMMDHFIDELQFVRMSDKSKDVALQQLEQESLACQRDLDDHVALLQQATQARERQQEVQRALEDRAKRAEEALALSEERAKKAEADLLIADQRRGDEVKELTEKIKSLEATVEAMEDNGPESGIEFCLRCLHKKQLIPDEWNSVDRILEEAPESDEEDRRKRSEAQVDDVASETDD